MVYTKKNAYDFINIIQQSREIKKQIKELTEIVKDIEDKVKSCNLKGIGKLMFEANRIITTLVVIDGTGIFTGRELGRDERNKLTDLKIRYDTALNEIDKCSR